MLRVKIVLSCTAFLFFGDVFDGVANDGMTRPQIDSLKKVGYGFLAKEPELVIEYAKNQLQASKDIRYYEGIYDAYYQMGYTYTQMEKHDEAIKNYFEAIYPLENEAIPNYKEKKIYALRGIGYCYSESFIHTTAIQYYEESLQIAYQINDSSQISSLNYNLGREHQKLKNYQNALKYYKTAISYLKPSDTKNHAKVFNALGNTHGYLMEYDVANSYYRKALDLSEYSISTYISNLGDNYYDQGQYDSAVYYYQGALEVSEKNENTGKKHFILNNLGDVYFDMGEYQKAIRYFSQTINDLGADIIDKEYRRSCKNISEAYEKIGDYQNALKYQDLYIVQSESIAELKENLQEQNSIYRMKEMEWQMERRAKDEKLATNDLIIFWLKLGSVALAIVLSIAGYQAIRYYKGIRRVKRWLATE